MAEFGLSLKNPLPVSGFFGEPIHVYFLDS